MPHTYCRLLLPHKAVISGPCSTLSRLSFDQPAVRLSSVSCSVTKASASARLAVTITVMVVTVTA